MFEFVFGPAFESVFDSVFVVIGLCCVADVMLLLWRCWYDVVAVTLLL